MAEEQCQGGTHPFGAKGNRITTAIQVPEALGHHMPYKANSGGRAGARSLLHGPHPKGMETLGEV